MFVIKSQITKKPNHAAAFKKGAIFLSYFGALRLLHILSEKYFKQV
jgi:hypothetical protein